MNDLVVFLNARLDEREAKARASGGEDPKDWFTVGGLSDSDAWNLDLADAEHIVANNPAHVLADVAAKRQIIEEHRDDEGWCLRCADPPQYDAEWHKYPCRTLRLLALPYASHSDYREAWRP